MEDLSRSVARAAAKTGLGKLRPTAWLHSTVEFIGSKTTSIIEQVGATANLLLQIIKWIYRSIVRPKVRIGRPNVIAQLVRVGVRSMFIVSLVSGCVGLILVLQMAPPLDDFGRKDLSANILGVSVLRELGPLIAAMVLTGFAGAAIAAELGTMVVGEEIEALEAQALNPIRFLVVPRVLATIIGLAVLTVLSNVVAILSGFAVAVTVVDIPGQTFWDNLMEQAKPIDFITGMTKSLIFGLLIGLIACSNGMRVTGGAAGVGKATTQTVVQSIVCIVIADMIFTILFFALKLN